MADKQSNKNNDKQQQARNLYFLSALTQAQIAELVGVSQKTISVWMNEGHWNYLKESALQTPAALIDQLSSEIVELHAGIAAREPGKRFATLQEAEIRRKTMLTINSLKQKQSTPVHTEVMLNFMNFAQKRATNVDELKRLTLLADQYLVGEAKLSDKPAFQPYTLPGQVIALTPPESDSSEGAPPSNEKDDADGESKAA